MVEFGEDIDGNIVVVMSFTGQDNLLVGEGDSVLEEGILLDLDAMLL